MKPTGRPRTWTDACLDAAVRLREHGMAWPEIHARCGGGRGTWNGLWKAVSLYRGVPLAGGKAKARDRADDFVARTLDGPNPRQRMMLRCEPPDVLKRLGGWQDL